MSEVVIYIVIFSIIVLLLLVFIVKSILSPKKFSAVEKSIALGKYSQAVKLAKKLLVKNDKDTRLRYLLGKAYLLDGKTELAMTEFTKISKSGLFPTKAMEIEFRTTLAGLYSKSGMTDEAMQEYVLLTKLDEKNPSYYYEMGKLFEERSKSDLAIANYEKAIELDSKYIAAYARLGFLLYQGNQVAEADKAISRALKLDPSNNEVLYNHGRILRAKKDYAHALASFEKAAREKSLRAKCFLERGMTYLETSNIEKAIFEFSRASKSSLDPRSNEALSASYLLADCYEKKRDLEKAIEEWRKIEAINPKFRDVKAKLQEYKDVQTNDHMKDYMTLGKEDFLRLAKAVTEQKFNSTIQGARETKNGCSIFAFEKETGKWLNERKKPQLFIFLRDSEVVQEEYLRNVYEGMKKQNVFKGFVITSSTFSKEALEFAANRPIELVDVNKLERILESVNFKL